MKGVKDLKLMKKNSEFFFMPFIPFTSFMSCFRFSRLRIQPRSDTR